LGDEMPMGRRATRQGRTEQGADEDEGIVAG
jgi:hypothetical protein